MSSAVNLAILVTLQDLASGPLARLREQLESTSTKLIGMGMAGRLAGQSMMQAMAGPVAAFANLDDAITNLRVAMMDNLGQVPAAFEEIKRQTVELGNLLPGTTADFANAATALIENGVALETVVKGGLKAASYLAVVLKMPTQAAAEMVAKFRESFGLAEDELVKMADLTQRAKFAFGLSSEEIKYAAQYAGATLNMLKLTGAENARLMLAIQGYARQRGMEGSVFGTNFAQMINQIGQMSQKLERNSKVMREVNEELARYGIQMRFFDDKGQFVGLLGMVKELEKLRTLSPEVRLLVNNRLFGMEGGRVASLLTEMGVEGLQRNLAIMDKQGDLMQRIDEQVKSMRNTWEALTGSLENLAAAFVGPFLESMKPLINRINELTFLSHMVQM